MSRPIRVLFVCMGNICRSPAGEGIMKRQIRERGLEDRFEIDSCGTGAWHVGNPADRRMRAAAKNRGFDLDSVARQLQADDLERFDYLLAADRSNLSDIVSLDRDGRYRDKAHLMLATHTDADEDEVPDPYYGGDAGFEHVLDLLEVACERWVDRMLAEQS